jgi:hypothetical protein
MAKPHRKKTGHPWVMAALVCQALLDEKDNVLSAIRIVDQFTIPLPPGWDGKTNLQMPVTGLVGFKSGDVKGPRTVRFYGVSPTGKRQKAYEAKVVFLGGHTGVNIKINMTFGFKTEGTHWLEVYVDKWLATRIPLTIVFQPTKEEVPPSGPTPSKE